MLNNMQNFKQYIKYTFWWFWGRLADLYMMAESTQFWCSALHVNSGQVKYTGK